MVELDSLSRWNRRIRLMVSYLPNQGSVDFHRWLWRRHLRAQKAQCLRQQHRSAIRDATEDQANHQWVLFLLQHRQRERKTPVWEWVLRFVQFLIIHLVINMTIFLVFRMMWMATVHHLLPMERMVKMICHLLHPHHISWHISHPSPKGNTYLGNAKKKEENLVYATIPHR